jgi:hypothetical protein
VWVEVASLCTLEVASLLRGIVASLCIGGGVIVHWVDGTGGAELDESVLTLILSPFSAAK